MVLFFISNIQHWLLVRSNLLASFTCEKIPYHSKEQLFLQLNRAPYKQYKNIFLSQLLNQRYQTYSSCRLLPFFNESIWLKCHSWWLQFGPMYKCHGWLLWTLRFFLCRVLLDNTDGAHGISGVYRNTYIVHIRKILLYLGSQMLAEQLLLMRTYFAWRSVKHLGFAKSNIFNFVCMFLRQTNIWNSDCNLNCDKNKWWCELEELWIR